MNDDIQRMAWKTEEMLYKARKLSFCSNGIYLWSSPLLFHHIHQWRTHRCHHEKFTIWIKLHSKQRKVFDWLQWALDWALSISWLVLAQALKPLLFFLITTLSTSIGTSIQRAQWKFRIFPPRSSINIKQDNDFSAWNTGLLSLYSYHSSEPAENCN